MSEAKVNYLPIRVSAPQGYEYVHTAHSVVFPGWLIVSGYEMSDGDYYYYAAIKKKQKVDYLKINAIFTIKHLKSHYTEARLVQILEKEGIGRPSTFSSLVDKIQMRNYVKKMDIPGKLLKCKDYQLEEDVIEEIESSRPFGNEKSKLVIQPLGVMVIEFLVKHLEPLFRYSYTCEMEDRLDKVSKGEGDWVRLCELCDEQLESLIPSIPDKTERSITIDKNHIYMVGRYGPVIKYEKEGESTSFKKVREDIDLEKLRQGEYALEDILAPIEGFVQRRLGSYKSQDVILKKGRYGLYLTCGGTNYSLKGHSKKPDHIKLEDVLDVLLGKNKNKNILLELSKNMTLRKGKYGPYVYYKTASNEQTSVSQSQRPVTGRITHPMDFLLGSRMSTTYRPVYMRVKQPI